MVGAQNNFGWWIDNPPYGLTRLNGWIVVLRTALSPFAPLIPTHFCVSFARKFVNTFPKHFVALRLR